MNRLRLKSFLKVVPFAKFAKICAMVLAGVLVVGTVVLIFARHRAKEDVLAWQQRVKGLQSWYLETEPLVLEVGARANESALSRSIAARGHGDKVSRTKRGVRIEVAPSSGRCEASTVEIGIEGGKIARIEERGRAVKQLLLPGVTFDRSDPNPEQLRLYRPISRLPKSLLEAVLATEDRRFYEHGGIDLRATMRAFLVNARAGDAVQGGSTITQQLAKNLFLDSERTMTRKVRELFLAVALEESLTKQQLLEAYLNEIHFGRTQGRDLVGAGAAALMYFGKPVECLSLGESAVLAGIIKAPNALSPARHPERAKKRAAQVLAALKDAGFATKKELAAVHLDQLVFAAKESKRAAPHFADLAREEMSLPADANPATVVSTIDLEMQAAAEKALVEGLADLDRKTKAALDGAVVILEVKTGRILALVGGRDYVKSPFNRAAHAHRQIGSLAKPFVALTALHAGQIDTSSLIVDEPVQIKTSGGVWKPKNVDRRYRQQVTLHQALSKSINVPFVRLSQQIGLKRLTSMLRSLHLFEGDGYPALALGAFEATPIDVAAAFAAIANGGEYLAPHAVDRILDADGATIFEHQDEPIRITSPETAYQVFDMMRAAVNRGTAYRVRAVGYRHDVAGKTGTTDDTRDGWFAGVDGELAAVVWVGADSPVPTGLLAGNTAVPIWARLMNQVRKDRPPPLHVVPGNLRAVDVCDETGRVAGLNCPHVSRMLIRKGTVLEHCDELDHFSSVVCTEVDGNQDCKLIDEKPGEH